MTLSETMSSLKVSAVVSIERICLEIERFRGGFEGLKIVQLSDLHVRTFGPREMELIRLVNGEDPDFIFITGDLVVNYTNHYSACIQTLRELRAKSGVYVTLGNSDHTFRPIEHFKEFLNALRTVPVRLLRNQNARLNYKDRSFYLIGVDDPFFLFDDFDEAADGVCFEMPTILLAHSPDILFPRGDALVINLLDSGKKEDYFKTWGWAKSTYFGPERGDVYFKQDGRHTVRIQSRQDGVFVDALILNPYQDLEHSQLAGRFEWMEQILRTGRASGEYPDLVVIHAGAVSNSRIHGKWKKVEDSTALFGLRLDDLPPGRRWQYQPWIEPKDYFEADFDAKSEVRYHIWMRMKSPNGSPRNDSVYVQFNDAVDQDGKARYRISEPAHENTRLNEVDLILTGHTHGGQIRLPFYGALNTMTSIGRRYAGGLYRLNNSVLYVSRGVGYSILPIRILCPPEISVFTFHSYT